MVFAYLHLVIVVTVVIFFCIDFVYPRQLRYRDCVCGPYMCVSYRAQNNSNDINEFRRNLLVDIVVSQK